MSARTKVHGNRAVTCDVEGCSEVYVAAWWGNGANEARWQAQEQGWTRCLSFGDGVGGYPRFADICPAHEAHPPHCSCPRAMDITNDRRRAAANVEIGRQS